MIHLASSFSKWAMLAKQPNRLVLEYDLNLFLFLLTRDTRAKLFLFFFYFHVMHADLVDLFRLR